MPKILEIPDFIKHTDEHGFDMTFLSDRSSDVVLIVHTKTNEQPHVAKRQRQNTKNKGKIERKLRLGGRKHFIIER